MGSTSFCRGTITFLFLLGITSLGLKAQPIADFSYNAPVPNCNPAVYSFTNLSTGVAPLSYEWNFGVYPGVNSVFQDPATTFLNCGDYTVQLIVTDGNGDKDTTTQDITVWCMPTANYSVDNVSGCIPFDVTFNSGTSVAGSGTLVSYVWDYGDGYSGSGSDPMHTYIDAGCKQVTLIVTNSYGCVNDTTIDNVTCAYVPPVAGFTSSTATSCSTPFVVNYQDTSTFGLVPYTYQWIFEGGDPATDTSANPTVTYNTAGSYSTTLIVTDINGCTDTIVYDNYVVIANNTANITLSTDHGCPTLTVSASGVASSTPIGWNWTITPSGTISNATSQTPSISITDTGVYTLCLTVDFGGGCLAQNCTTITTHTAPNAYYSIDGLLNTCLRPAPVSFIDSSTGSNLSYAWSFPSGIPASANTSTPDTINYVACGTYSASLIVTDDFGCTDTYSTPSFLTITCPVANFTLTPSSGCIPLSVNFNSTTSTGTPVQWDWNFGDPSSGAANTDNTQNPNHIYNTPGCYTVTLITTSAEGCKDTTVMPNAVCCSTPPDVAFIATPLINCANLPIYFTNQSTGTFPYSTYTWDFHGVPPYNNESNQQNPAYVYEDTGWFDVTLIVSNYGCNDTLTIDHYVHLLPPVAHIAYTRSCAQPYVITFDGSASLGADSYTWVIAGGNPAVAFTQTVTVTYTTTGNHTVSLFVTNDSTGCTDNTSVTIPIRDVAAHFTGSPLSGCAPLTSCMSNTSVDAVSYAWLVTNSSGTTVATSTSTSPCFTLTTPGVYSVRLIATDQFGCKDTLYRPSYINVWGPIADFIGFPLSGCTPLHVDFTDQSTAPTSTITGWSWNFGDPTSGVNNISTLQNPSHTYNNPGYYTVTLTVTDNHGCTSVKTRTNYIHAIHPTADFVLTDTTVCAGTTACFINTSTGTGLTYEWDFGNGNTSTTTNPCYTYTVNGDYTIILITTDATGCIDTAVNYNYVNVTHPTANLVADTLGSSCPPLTVHFTNLSVDAPVGSTYKWIFGDGQISSAQNPSHIYNIAGTFDVTLIVTNPNGCKDTIVFNDYITIGGPQGYISMLPTSGCVPHYTCFQAVSSSTINFTWNFGDGTVTVNGDSICHTYTTTGSFYSELILNDGVGCVYALPIGVVVVNGANCAFNLDNPFLCENGTVQFSDSSYGTSPVSQWVWNFGDAASGAQNTSSLQNPNHYFASTGTYVIHLDITTVDGCTNSATDTVEVASAPVTYFDRVDSSSCAPDSVHFFDQTTSVSPIVSYYWNFDDPTSGAANSDTLPNTVHFYQFPGTYNVTLTTVAANGCSDSRTLPVYVHDTVVADAGPDQIICSGTSALLNATGGALYSWTPAATLSNANIASPIATPLVTTTYTVTVSNIWGCFDVDTTVVTVVPLPVISSLTHDNDTCADDHAQAIVVASGGTPGYTYNWNSSPVQTNDTATNLTGNHTYTVIVTDANGCTVSNTVFIVDLPGPNANAHHTNTTCGNINGGLSVTTTGGNGSNIYVWNTGATTTTISNIPVGSYSVTVTDQFGCSDNDNTTVSNTAGPTGTISANPTTCSSNNSLVNLTPSGGTSPLHYLWSTGATTQDLTNQYAGTYTVTITDANNCTFTVSTTVTDLPSPSLSLTQVNATCQINNASINVTVTNGTAPFIYNWNNNTYNTEDLSNIYSGTYTLIITDANNCKDTITTIITDTPVPSISYATIPSTCGNSNGSIDITVTGGITPYTYIWWNGATSEDLDSIPAGSYGITILAANGCTIDTIINLNDISAPALTIAPTNNTCGLVNGSIDLSLTGGTSPFIYQWSGGETTQDISNLAIGTYNVTVTDNNGCLSFENVTLINIPGPSLASVPANSTCGNANGTVTLIVTGGTAPFTYNWDNGATTQNLSAVASGIYNVTVTDANNCSAIESATVNNTNGPSISYTTQNSTCGNSNGAIDLTIIGGTAPYIISWNGGAFTTEDISNLPSGNYDVTVTDQNGCTIGGAITLNNTDGPSLTATVSNTTCGNENGSIDLTVTGGTLPLTYDWNTGAYSTEDIDSLYPGSYSVVVTDSNNCSATISENIIDVAGPTASAVAVDVTCAANNGTITLTVTGGTSPFTYVWSNGETTQNLTNLSTGIYDVTVMDANLCSTTASAIVSDVPGPFSSSAMTSATCGNNNGSIDLAVVAGLAPYNYQWSNGGTTQDLTGLAIGWYFVTITDQNNCALTDSAEVTNINGPSLSTSTIDETCGSTNGQVYLTVNSGTSPYNYQWSNGDITQNLNYVSAGTYTVTVTDNNGCTATTTTNFTNIPGPTALTFGSQNSTCGNANGMAWVSVTGGTTPYTYHWNTSPVQATDTAFNVNGGATYSVTVTDSNGCVITGSAPVSNIAGPTYSITQTNCTCGEYNGAIALTTTAGTAPYGYTWSNGETTEDIDSLQPGTYSVTITDVNGCSVTATVTVNNIFGPYLSYTSINTTCGNNNGSIDLTVSGGTAPFFYDWNSGQFATQDLVNLAAGIYSIHLADAAGCQVDTVVSLSDIAGPTVTVTPQNSTCGYNNGFVNAVVTGGTSPLTYAWSNASIDSFAANLVAGNYSVSVTDSNGCVAIANAVVANTAGPSATTTHIDETCGSNNGSVDLTVISGTAPFTYDWNSGLYNTQDLTNLSQGTYFVIVTDSNNCQVIALQNVDSLPAPVMNSTVTDAPCSNNIGAIDITISGGTSPFTYNWSNGVTVEDLNSLASGTYTLTFTDGSGCSLIDSMVVNGSVQPTLSLTSINANCGNNIGSIDLTIANGTSPFTISWSHGATTEDIDSLGAGLYVVSVIDSNGCSASDSAIIVQNFSPELTINSTNESCAGNDGTVSLDIVGGTNPLTFIWSNGATIEDITGLTAGTYSVTVTDANGCSSETFADVLSTISPVISYTSVNTHCGQSTGAIDISIFGGSYPLNYLWSNGATTEDLSGLISGTYTVTLTDAANCAVIDSIIVADSPAPSMIVDSTFDAGCNNSGAIYVSVVGGASPYTYSWTNGSTTQDNFNLSGGNYVVVVTDSFGCSASASATINNSTPQTLTDISTNETCNSANANIDLTVFGGASPFSFNWSNGTTTEDLINISAGNYSVTVTDSLGCAVSLTETIINNSSPVASMLTTNSSCNLSNGSIDLTIIGGTSPFTILWSNGSTDEDISSLSIGNYAVTITDINLCTASGSTNVSTIPIMSLSFSVNSALCANADGSVNLSVAGGTAPYIYLWSNGVTTQDINGITSGTYYITVTDFSGCQKDTSVTVGSTSNFTMTLNAGTSVCQTPTGTINVVLNGSGTPPYQYYWSNDTAYHDNHRNSLAPGLYTITVVDASGCSVVNSIVVGMQGATPHAGINYSGNVCQNPGSVTFSHQGGTSQLDSIHWYMGNGASGNWTPFTYTYTSPGTYTVTEIVYKGYCTDTATVTVTIYPTPVASGNSLNPICNPANSGIIDLNISGGTNPLNYYWSNGSTTQDLSNILSGTYTVTVIDANGCSTNSNFVLNSPSPPIASSTTTSAFCALATGSVNLSVSNGNAPYNFQWSNGETNEDLLNILSGNYNVIVTDQSGCTASTSAIVLGSTGLALNAVATSTSCGLINGSIDLTVTGGTSPYTFIWDYGQTIEDLNALSSGVYSVTITDANGCQSNGTWIINPSTVLVATVSNIIYPTCVIGGAVIVDVTGGSMPYSYFWNNGATAQDLVGLTGGYYSLTVTDAYGCSSVISATLSNPVPPTASLTITNAHCSLPDGSIDLSVTGGATPYSYFWNNGFTTEDIDSLYPATYTIVITDSLGCTAIDSAIINSTAGPSLTGAVTQPTCSGTLGSINVNAAGGTNPYSYLWSTGTLGNSVSLLTAGGYSVTVIDNFGCQDEQSFIIDSADAQIVLSELISNSNCLNNSGSVDLTVLGGTLPYTFNWSNGSTTEDVSSLASGNYVVTVSDSTGCFAIDSFQISSSIPPVLSVISSPASCAQSNGTVDLTISGGNSPYSIFWNNGTTTEDLSGIVAGNYVVTVTDANGCNATDSIIVGNSNGPSVTVAVINSTCGNNNGSIDVTVTGGTLPYSFIWSNGETAEDIDSLFAGTYQLTVTDASGCNAFANASIQTTTPATSSIASTAASCNQSNGTVDLIVAGTSPFTFNWNNGATTEDLITVSSGAYSVTITDSSGCVTLDSIVVNNSNGPVLTGVTSNSTCGNANGAVDVTVSGGATPYSYSWSNGSTTEDISSIISGTYYITVNDATGCFAIDSFIINNTSAPALIIVSAPASCNQSNGATDLTISGGTSPYTILWNSGATTEDLSGVQSGTYNVTVTDASGCTTNDSTIISENQGPELSVASIDATCLNNNGSVDLTISGGVFPLTYQWDNGATTEDISGLSAGTYIVVVTDANGCTANAVADILSATSPVASLVSTSASCNQNNGSADLTVIGGTSPYNFNWSNGQTTEDINNLSTGTYYVTVTDIAGCAITDSVIIGNANGPALTALVSQSTCGNANGSINLTVTGGSIPYNYNWSNGATTANISTLIANSYSITVTDATGCFAIDSFTINTTSSPTLSNTIVDASCGQANGAIDLTVIGGNAPYIVLWSNGTTTEDLNGIAAGNYSVTVTDASGCSATAVISVSNSNGPGAATSSINSTCGNNNGVIDVTVTGGTSPYTYIWSNGATTEDLNSLLAGNYQVTISDASGCNAYASATIQTTVAPTLILTPTPTNCNQSNGSINLSVTGGASPYNYAWSNGATTANISSLLANSYFVTVTDSLGCYAIDSVLINNLNGPSVSVSTTQPSCVSANASINLTVTGGVSPYNYNWSNGATTTNISSLSANTYFVTVTDAGGCSVIDSSIINSFSSPSVQIDTVINANCSTTGSITITVSGGNAPYNYNWNNGATTDDINNLLVGIYSLTVTDVSGCMVSVSSTITGTPAPVISMTTVSAICNQSNGSIDLTIAGGTLPFSYNWNNGSTSQDINGVTVGSYTVSVTDQNGCVVIDSAIVGNTAGPVATSIIIQPSCTASTGSIDLTVTGGTAPYSFIWSNGTTSEDLSSIGGGFYDVTISDASGCQTLGSYLLVGIAPVSVTVNTVAPICLGDSVQLNAFGGSTYTWTPNFGLSATTGSSVWASPTVNMTYVVTGFNILGCFDTAMVTVTVHPNPTISATQTNPVICYGDSSKIVAAGGTSYTWSPSTSLYFTSFTTAYAHPTVNTTYTITGTNAFGCTSSTTIIVDVLPQFTVTVSSPDTELCSGETTTLIATGALSYTWSPSAGLNATTGSNVTASPSQTTTYYVTGINANGCDVTDSLIVIVHPPVVVNINPVNPTICIGSSINLNATGAVNYIWSPSQGLNTQIGSSVIASPTVTTTYIVTGTDSFGCVGFNAVIVTIGTSLTLYLNNSAPAICNGTSTTLIVNGAFNATYSWTPSVSFLDSTGMTVIVNPNSNATYTVVATDNNGCTGTTTATVTVNTPPVISATNAIACYGSSTALTATGATDYLWSPVAGLSSSTGANQIAAPDSTTIYTIIGTDLNGCADTTQSTFVVNPLPVLSANPSVTSICNGSSATITASGASTYQWIPSTGLNADTGSFVIAQPLVTTTYTIFGTDTTGCSNSVTAIVNVGAPVNIINTPLNPTLCLGDSIAISLAGASTYQWSPTAGLSASTGANVVATPLVNTVYTIIGTDTNGCTGSAIVNVMVNPNLVVNGMNASVCVGGSVTLTSSGAYFYMWTPDPTLNSFYDSSVVATPVVNTTYTLTAMNMYGCVDTALFAVNINPLPAVTLDGLEPFYCVATSPDTLIGTPQGGVFSGYGVTGNTFNPPIAGIGGPYLVTYTFTDSLGCSNTDTDTTQVGNTAMIIAASANTTICNGSSTILNAMGGVSYTWSPSTGLSDTTGASVTASPLATTTYFLNGTNVAGCVGSDSIVVTVAPFIPLAITASADSICGGTSTTITVTGSSNYTWLPAVQSANANNDTVIVSPNFTTTYTVTAVNAGGCSSDTTVVITILPQPIVTVNSPAICSGDAATLIAQGASTYNWAALASTNDTVTVQPLVTTSYTVIGNTNSCSDTAIAVVSMLAAPVVTVNNDTICSGSTATLVGNGASNYTWLPMNVTGNSVSVTPTVTSTYTLIGNNGSCADTAIAIVLVNTTPVVSFSGLQPIYCSNNTLDTLIGIPVGGIFSGAGVTGNIFDPNAVSGNSTITYSYTDANGCSAIDSQSTVVGGGAAVTVNPPLSTICNSSSSILTAGGASTYTWAPSTGLNTTTGDQVVASPTASITYTVTGITANGCSGQATAIVNIATNLVLNISATNDSICSAQTISITAVGGTNYTWSPATFLSASTGATVSAQPTSSITYTVTASNAGGCTGQNSIPITLLPNPSVTVTNDTVCAGQFATLVASGATNYHWSTNALGNTISVNPLTSTSYTVIGMNGACADTATAFVSVNPLPVINVVSSGNFICNGGTVQLDASGAANYQWSPSIGLNQTNGSTVTASLTSSTTYTVSGTDVNGCANTQSIPVTVALPVIISSNAVDTTICFGQSVLLNVNGANNFAWSPSTGLSSTNGNTVSANPSSTTTYTVTGTDANGCTAIISIIVRVNAIPTVTASSSSNTLCASSSATLNAFGAANYIWTPSIGLSSSTGSVVSAIPNSSVTYTVTGIDSFGCAAIATVNIAVLPAPVISINSTNPTICLGASTTLSASGASTYSWSPSTNLNSTTNSSVIANPVSTTTYTVSAIDSNGCAATSTSTVTVQPLPVIGVTALDSTLCFGHSTTLTASGASTYDWSPSIGLSATTGTIVSANPNVNTTYLVKGYDAIGCQAINQIVVYVVPNPVINITPNNPAICPGDFTTLIATGALNYHWSTNALGDSIAVNPIVNTSYTVTGTDANGCSASDTALVSINPTPTISAIANQNNFCQGSNTIITASGGTDYTWYPSYGLNVTTGVTVIATPVATTTYTIVGSNATGCTNSTTIVITVYQNPIAVAGPDVDLCQGSNVQLNATGGTSYEWTPQTGLDNPYIANPNASPAASTQYIVNVGNQNGCHAADTININVHIKPNVNAGQSLTVCFPDSTVLHGDGAAYYQWMPADYLNDSTLQSPTCTPQFDITYTLTVSDSFGCAASDTVTVKVKRPFTINADPDISVCRNNAAQLKATGGNNYQWTPSTGLDNPTIPNPVASPSSTTTYTVYSSDGICFSAEDTVVVTVNQLPQAFAGADAELLYGSTYQLYGYTNSGNIQWTPSDFLSCTTCADPVVNHLNTPMTYIFNVTDSMGCRAEDSVHISLVCNEDLVYVPNAFTPNGDNKNDVFRIRTYGLSQVKAFRVFNRWGEMVFETYDVSQGWDGTWKGEACTPAVYVYYLEGTCANGQAVLKQGNVTLIR